MDCAVDTGASLYCAVDTGASQTFVQESVLRENNIRFDKAPVKCKDVSAEGTLICPGTLELLVRSTHHAKGTLTRIIVCSNLSHRCLLGKKECILLGIVQADFPYAVCNAATATPPEQPTPAQTNVKIS